MADNGTTLCYFPDGTPALTSHPCGNPSQGHSACCHDDYYCMTGGLCLDSYVVMRRTCLHFLTYVVQVNNGSLLIIQNRVLTVPGTTLPAPGSVLVVSDYIQPRGWTRAE